MDIQYKFLFNELGFWEIRNKIFEEFYSKLMQFLKDKKDESLSLDNLPELYSEYFYKKQSIFQSEILFLKMKI